MTISAILALVLMIAILGGVVLYGMDGEPTIRSETKKPTVVSTPSLDIAEYEERLQNVQSEEEIIEIVKEVATHPDVLNECAKIHKEYEIALSKLDMNNQKSKDKVFGLFKELDKLFCLASINDWLEP